MRERKLSSTGSINVDTLKLKLQHSGVSPANINIIIDAAQTADYSSALAKLDNVKKETQRVSSYYILELKNNFVRSGNFQFLYKAVKNLIGEQEVIDRMTGYGSISDSLLEQLDVADAINVCLKQLNWYGIRNISLETESAIKYLLDLDTEEAVSLLSSVFSNGSMSYHTIISLITIYTNRLDVASKFDFTGKIHEYLRMYADLSGANARKIIEGFDYKTQVATMAEVGILHKMVHSKKDGIGSVLGMVCLTYFDKSEFIAKFAGICLPNMDQIVSGGLCLSFKENIFNLLNIDGDAFTEFVRTIKDKERFLIQSNSEFIKRFAEDTTLDPNCIITHVAMRKNLDVYMDFITQNTDMSTVAIAPRDKTVDLLRHLTVVNELYIGLFGENETSKRIVFLHKLVTAYYTIDIDVIEQLTEYNVNDETIMSLLTAFANGDFISDFSKAQLSGKPFRKLEAVLKVFKGRTTLIDKLLVNYKDREINIRFLIVLILGDNLDSYLDAFLKINESSKSIQTAVAKVYRDNPSLVEAELVKLKDKKLAVRKSAFNLLKSAYGSKYNQQIEEAMNVEENEKLKLEMESHLNTMDDVDENNISISKILETLIKNRRKVDFVYKDMPQVHDIEGNIVEEDHLICSLIAYANEPIAGVSTIGRILARKLDANDFAKFAQQAYYNFMDDGAEAKKKWVLYFASIHGGFDMVEILKSQIAKWAENSRGAIAGEATKALALNPAPLALLTVDAMSRKYKFKQVKNAAIDAMEFAANQLKITKEELSDRIVPNLGFDESMKINFNYGSRSFDVYLNTALELEVYDDKGKKIKTIPAVGKTDDQEIATASLKEFKELKKQLKATVTTQRDRLDMALADGRKWTKEAYENLFVKNPIMHQFAIGLVWGIYSEGKLQKTFRYMEDGSFNSAEEDEIYLEDNMIIGVVHPLELGKELLDSWKEQLSDYEIVQPVLQLERAIYSKKEDELKGREATELAGKIISPATLSNKLLAAGFVRGEILDAGFFYTFVKVNNDLGICGELVFSGTSVGYYEDGPAVTKEIRFYDIEHMSLGDWGRKAEHYMNIADVDDKFYSEIFSAVAKATATSTETDPEWRVAGN